MSKHIIGIDLGTGFSCCAVLENNQPKVIVNSEGQRTTPSIVSYKGNDILVGKPAQNVQITNPLNTAYVVKRFIGRKYDEALDDVNKMPYKINKASNGDIRIHVGDKDRSPEEISAQVLMKLKKAAEDYLGEPVTEAVITVPAYFNNEQREATKVAGKIAGLDVKRIVNEPTAAAMAFGIKDDSDKKIMVVDVGSGTSDFSVLEVGDGVYEVKATAGDSQLGGTDFTYAIVDYVNDMFKNENGIDLKKDPMALQRLVDACDKAKIELSSSTSTDINIPFITATAEGPKHLNYTITKAKFEQLIEPFLKKLKTVCNQAIKDSSYSVNDFDDILLVGGSTRVPAVQELVKEIFGKEGNKSVNPDEAVAEGAAIQAGVLSGEVKDILLLDVIPLSLGIETEGGVMTKLIDRNTTVPTSKSQVFSTAMDGQTAVTIHVLQGERPLASQNKTLGNFNLTDIPVAPRGVPQIEVTLDVSADSTLKVTAKDLGTGKDATITISNGSGMTDAEIQSAIKEAEIHREEDAKLKEKIDIKNEAEGTIFATEKSLKDYGDKLTEEEKSDIQKSIDELKTAKDTDDVEDIKSKTQKLKEASYKIAEKMYANTQGQQSTEMPEGFADMFKNAKTDGSKTTPTDADYEVVD